MDKSLTPRDAAFNDLAKLSRQANARILSMERALGKDHTAVQRAYATAAKVTGKKGATRFAPAVLKDASLKDIIKYDAAVQTVLHSAYGTKASREKISRKSRESFKESHKSVDYSNDSLDVLDSFIDLKKILREETLNYNRVKLSEKKLSEKEMEEISMKAFRSLAEELHKESDLVLIEIDKAYMDEDMRDKMAAAIQEYVRRRMSGREEKSDSRLYQLLRAAGK